MVAVVMNDGDEVVMAMVRHRGREVVMMQRLGGGGQGDQADDGDGGKR